MKNETNYSGDTGFFTLLTILFIGLKLTGYIDWSWGWVLSPVWLPIVIATAIGGIYLFVIAFTGTKNKKH